MKLSQIDPEAIFDPHRPSFLLRPQTVGTSAQLLRQASRFPDVHRPYQPGDPVQRLDWRAYARTDHLLVREVHEEAQNAVLVAIDIGPTMDWPPLSEVSSKLAVALNFGFYLLSNHLKESDRVAFSFWHESKTVGVKNCNLGQLRLYYDKLSKAGFGRDACLDLMKGWTDLNVPNFTLKILISDLLSEETFDPSFRLLHLLSSLEVSTDWVNAETCYFDETSAPIEFLGQNLSRSRFLIDAVEKWRLGLRQRYPDLVSITDASPVEDVLVELGYKA